MVTLGLAVIAHDIDHALQISGHGMFGNVSGAGFPSRRHALLTHHRLFANWAAVIKASQFSEAMRMNGMSARQVLRRLTRRKHVFTAHRTVVLVLVLEALVCVKDAHRNAHTAFAAMAESFDTSDTAKATLLTVKGLFGLCNGGLLAMHPDMVEFNFKLGLLTIDIQRLQTLQ